MRKKTKSVIMGKTVTTIVVYVESKKDLKRSQREDYKRHWRSYRRHHNNIPMQIEDC